MLDLIHQIPYFVELVSSAIALLVAYLAYKIIIHKIVGKIALKTKMDEQYVQLIRWISSLVMSVVVILTLLGIFGLMGAFWGIFAGAGFLGIVVGMATKDFVSDVITGLQLYIYQPFMIGDPVEIGDVGGVVKNIDLRGVTLKAWSGEILVIPNSKVRNSIIKNYSVEQRMLETSLCIDYTSDIDKALKVCKKALEKLPWVIQDPEPVIRVDDFTEDGVTILLLIWFPNDRFWEGYAEVKKRLAKEFRKEGLKIPAMRIKNID
ncbi:MAG: mechanosensitive ion channel family protein [Thermoproteota archaeon]